MSQQQPRQFNLTLLVSILTIFVVLLFTALVFNYSFVQNIFKVLPTVAPDSLKGGQYLSGLAAITACVALFSQIILNGEQIKLAKAQLEISVNQEQERKTAAKFKIYLTDNQKREDNGVIEAKRSTRFDGKKAYFSIIIQNLSQEADDSSSFRFIATVPNETSKVESFLPEAADLKELLETPTVDYVQDNIFQGLAFKHFKGTVGGGSIETIDNLRFKVIAKDEVSEDDEFVLTFGLQCFWAKNGSFPGGGEIQYYRCTLVAQSSTIAI